MIYKYLLLKCFIFFFLLSIVTDKQTSSGFSKLVSQSQDSVWVWIKEGRNTDFPLERRKQSLKKAYQKAELVTNDSLKTKYFSRLSLAYLRLPDSALFRETNQRTIELAKIAKDTTVQAEAHWDLAEFFRSQAVLDSAYYHFAEAHKLYSSLGDDFFAARMLYNMAAVQADVKDYTGSEITTIKAIELLKPLERYEQLYSCYNNLAVVTNSLKEYDRAIEYHKEALNYLKKINQNKGLRQATQNNLGVVYQEKGEHQNAIPYFQTITENKEILKSDPQLYAKALINLGYSNLKLEDFSNLPDLFLKGIQIQDSIGDIQGVSRSHYNLAEYYLAQKDTVEAISQAQKAKNYAEQSSNNKRLLETLQLMARLEPKNALTYTQRYITLNDSLLQEERQARNKFARIRFETDEFIAENQILAREKQLWTGIAVGLLLLGVSTYIILDQRAKNQKLRFQQQQQSNNQEIFNLMLSQNQKVEEGKKLEQKRISEELHDGVLGKMLGARMMLTGLNRKFDEEAISQRTNAINALQEVEQEVRAISHELSHAAYQKINNFVRSIEDLLKPLPKTAHIEYNLNYDDQVDWDGLTGDIKINLYRVVQESLQNCVKHAECQKVSVNFVKEGNTIVISVMDDGKGFTVKKGKKGIGMRNIASRMDKVGGYWDIWSSKGEGTTISFKIPIRTFEELETGNNAPGENLKDIKTA